MIILLGKHQFTVSSVDESNNNNNNNNNESDNNKNNSKRHSINPDTILSLVENAERLILDLDNNNNNNNSNNNNNDSKDERINNKEEVSAM